MSNAKEIFFTGFGGRNRGINKGKDQNVTELYADEPNLTQPVCSDNITLDGRFFFNVYFLKVTYLNMLTSIYI